MNNTTINYQPWLQAVLTVARHYRIESSEERIRLELNWSHNQGLDDYDSAGWSACSQGRF